MSRGFAKIPSALIAALVVTLAVGGLSACGDPRSNRRQTSTAGSNMIPVPSVVGVARDSALAALTAQGLEGQVVDEVETCNKPDGAILRQDPPGMTQAEKGSKVRLVLARRSAVALPEPGSGITVLAPGTGHTLAGADGRETRVELLLAGQPCAAGTAAVSHPSAGFETYDLRTGERAERTIQGSGEITIRFDSLNEGARLVVRSD